MAPAAQGPGQDEGQGPLRDVKNWRITPAILTRFGSTDRCPVCEYARNVWGAKAHSQECRRRLEDAMREAGLEYPPMLWSCWGREHAGTGTGL